MIYGSACVCTPLFQALRDILPGVVGTQLKVLCHHVSQVIMWCHTLQVNGKMLQALVTTMDSWRAPFECPTRLCFSCLDVRIWSPVPYPCAGCVHMNKEVEPNGTLQRGFGRWVLEVKFLLWDEPLSSSDWSRFIHETTVVQWPR